MNFWDTSAVIALLVDQADSERVERARGRDAAMVVWWGTLLECASALGRLRREKALDAEQARRAHAELLKLSMGWGEVDPLLVVRERAIALVERHPLKAADAFQLAAATIALAPAGAGSREAQGRGQGATRAVGRIKDEAVNALGEGPAFICLDRQLAAAARKEGLAVFPGN